MSAVQELWNRTESRALTVGSKVMALGSWPDTRVYHKSVLGCGWSLAHWCHMSLGFLRFGTQACGDLGTGTLSTPTPLTNAGTRHDKQPQPQVDRYWFPRSKVEEGIRGRTPFTARPVHCFCGISVGIWRYALVETFCILSIVFYPPHKHEAVSVHAEDGDIT